jgi:hypothetical protein
MDGCTRAALSPLAELASLLGDGRAWPAAGSTVPTGARRLRSSRRSLRRATRWAPRSPRASHRSPPWPLSGLRSRPRSCAAGIRAWERRALRCTPRLRPADSNTARQPLPHDAVPASVPSLADAPVRAVEFRELFCFGCFIQVGPADVAAAAGQPDRRPWCDSDCASPAAELDTRRAQPVWVSHCRRTAWPLCLGGGRAGGAGGRRHAAECGRAGCRNDISEGTCPNEMLALPVICHLSPLSVA